MSELLEEDKLLNSEGGGGRMVVGGLGTGPG